MHGAFKMPGGKLVQVDFDLEDEHLRNVEVTGDFFLYPEEALTEITAAVEGSPADMSMADRTTCIAAAIDARRRVARLVARGAGHGDRAGTARLPGHL